jgi:hypothetical protein
VRRSRDRARFPSTEAGGAGVGLEGLDARGAGDAHLRRLDGGAALEHQGEGVRGQGQGVSAQAVVHSQRAEGAAAHRPDDGDGVGGEGELVALAVEAGVGSAGVSLRAVPCAAEATERRGESRDAGAAKGGVLHEVAAGDTGPRGMLRARGCRDRRIVVTRGVASRRHGRAPALDGVGPGWWSAAPAARNSSVYMPGAAGASRGWRGGVSGAGAGLCSGGSVLRRGWARPGHTPGRRLTRRRPHARL